jgi:hypothetical protein
MSDVIEELAKQEPWRRGQGQPANALDPTWNIERSAPCDGEIKYHAGSVWWSCEKCGYCGKHGYRGLHRPINDPQVYLIRSVISYIAQRANEGVSRAAALKQMFHIAGVAIRYAASKKTEELEDYVQQLIVR